MSGCSDVTSTMIYMYKTRKVLGIVALEDMIDIFVGDTFEKSNDCDAGTGKNDITRKTYR
jgi:hypothetical protein